MNPEQRLERVEADLQHISKEIALLYEIQDSLVNERISLCMVPTAH